MKVFVSLAALGLAGCSQADQTAELVDETEAEAPMLMSLDGGPAIGTFETTSASGLVLIHTVNADGTFTNEAPDGSLTTGTWTRNGPEQYCTTAQGAAAAVCYDGVIDENGVWTSTNTADPADVWTLKRL